MKEKEKRMKKVFVTSEGIYRIYEMIKDILSKSIRPLEKNKVIKEINKHRERLNLDSVGPVQSVIYYFEKAIQLGKKKEAEEAFRDIFCEELKDYDEKYNTLFAPYIAMKLEGLEDFLSVDTTIASAEFIPETKAGFLFKKIDEIYSFSKCDDSVLIIGESGTSKELTARVIHKLSNRRKAPFEEINCAAIPETLIESELFGVIANYPGLHNKKELKGKLKLADEGTFFLDEIGKMSEHAQVKLLKAIDEKKYFPLGSEKPIEIDVRFIAAKQPKDKLIDDLKWRLGHPDIILMPTLNERLNILSPEDNTVFNNSLRIVLREKNLRPIEIEPFFVHEEKVSITAESYKILKNYEYKGNYRELKNILRAAVRSAFSKNPDAIKRNKKVKILAEDLYLISKSNIEHTISPDTLKDIRLRDIIEHANKVRGSILETKVKEVLRSGKNIKTVLREEGLNESQYQSWRNSVERITGKKIRDFKNAILMD